MAQSTMWWPYITMNWWLGCVIGPRVQVVSVRSQAAVFSTFHPMTSYPYIQ